MSEGRPDDIPFESEGPGAISELIDGLTLKIEANQHIIDRIISNVDAEFNFPKIPEEYISSENELKEREDGRREANTIPHEVDILKKLLNSKYKLDEIIVTDDESEENLRIRELISDNKKLEILHKRALKRNKEYLGIVEGYEEFTVNEVLPALRSDSYDYIFNSLFRDFKENLLEEKYETDNKLWDRYIRYLEKLQTLSKLSSNLISVLQNESRDDEVQIIYSKLVIINKLKEFLLSRISRTQPGP